MPSVCLPMRAIAPVPAPPHSTSCSGQSCHTIPFVWLDCQACACALTPPCRPDVVASVKHKRQHYHLCFGYLPNALSRWKEALVQNAHTVVQTGKILCTVEGFPCTRTANTGDIGPNLVGRPLHTSSAEAGADVTARHSFRTRYSALSSIMGCADMPHRAAMPRLPLGTVLFWCVGCFSRKS